MTFLPYPPISDTTFFLYNQICFEFDPILKYNKTKNNKMIEKVKLRMPPKNLAFLKSLIPRHNKFLSP